MADTAIPAPVVLIYSGLHDAGGNALPNVLKDLPGDLISVSATTIVNGGASDCTLEMSRDFSQINSIIENDRIQIFLPDDLVTPWWDGRVTGVDMKSTSIGGRLTITGEGWETQLNDDLVNFTVAPGVQADGVDYGQLDYAVLLAWLLQGKAAPTGYPGDFLAAGYTVSVPASAGINVMGMQANNQGLGDTLNTVTQSILDASGAHWEWYADGGPLLTKHVLVQPVSVFEAIPIALDKNADCSNYDVMAQYNTIKNMVAMFGGNDPTSTLGNAQVWAVITDAVSIALYGLRQTSQTNSYLVTLGQVQQYATAQLDVLGYPVYTGGWQMKIASAAIRAGKWVQVFEPELLDLRTMRLSLVSVAWSAGTYITQTVQPNAPLHNLDSAIYVKTVASSQAVSGNAVGTTNRRFTSNGTPATGGQISSRKTGY